MRRSRSSSFPNDRALAPVTLLLHGCFLRLDPLNHLWSVRRIKFDFHSSLTDPRCPSRGSSRQVFVVLYFPFQNSLSRPESKSCALGKPQFHYSRPFMPSSLFWSFFFIANKVNCFFSISFLLFTPRQVLSGLCLSRRRPSILPF